MRKKILAMGLAVAVVLAGSLALGASPMNADGKTVAFGRVGVGSGCVPPGCSSDASFHALDRMVPGAVNVRVGDTVTFQIAGFHQVAIYEPGVKVKDIEVTDFFIDDPDGRVYLGASPIPSPPATDSFTFNQRGRYLVICTIAPHFEEAQMWGWVHVR